MERPLHPHEAVAQAMGGGNMMNGAPNPSGEELGEVTRLLEMHHEALIIIVPLVLTYFAIMRWYEI